jgi:hypothetical protein
MSERTAPALAKLDELLPALKVLPASANRDQLIEEADALRRAVAAFHMEAIRFRMYSVDRLLKIVSGGDDARNRALFEDLRGALETAGFHTRSHTAP